MAKRTFAVLVVAAVAVFLLTSAGCVSKKRFRTAEEQNAQKLAQANARIDELQKKSDALDQGLKDAQSALAAAESRNKQLAADAASLKGQIAALEGQKAELDKALAAGKETEASYQKKVRALNGSLAALKKKMADLEAAIAAKEAEIGALRQSEAALKATTEDQSKKMAALNADKTALQATLDKTVASKKQTTLILGILLALAVLLAVVGFVAGRKKAA